MKLNKLSPVLWGLPIAVVLCLLPRLASTASAQSEPHVGTWDLNLAKSTFTPGPAPTKQTLTFQAAGPHWTALVQGIDASGRPINPDMSNLVINFDGKDHPTPSEDYESSVWKRVNASRYEVVRKKAGKVVLTATNVVSADGRTMTITTKGVNAHGQSVDNVAVYDKR